MNEELRSRYLKFYKSSVGPTTKLPNGKTVPLGEVKNYGSAFYDLFYKSNYNKRIDQRLNLKNKTILDIGCGSGKFCFDAVHLFDAKKCYGIDIASVELGVTDVHLHDRIEFFQGDSTEIPLENDSVDLVTSFLVLEHVPKNDLLKIFYEMDRVSREGWILAISHEPSKYSAFPPRETVEKCGWWINEIEKYMSEVVTLQIPSDNFKWGLGQDVGYSRLVCTSKKFRRDNDKANACK